MNIENLFFELVRVAIGTQSHLSCIPEARVWNELYAMAKKQSLVGICFAGVQKLVIDTNNDFAKVGINEMLYLKWMGMAAKIQQRNDVVNRRSIDLQQYFTSAGFKSCVLKGQDYACYYDNLCQLRQSGDIDLWVDGDRDKVIDYARNLGVRIGHIDIKHSDMCFFEDTDVEVHFQPSWMYSPLTGNRLNKWFKSFEFSNFCTTTEGIVVPPNEFSLVYCMVHIYRHFFSEGIGLRQVLDMYFLLLHSSKKQRDESMAIFKNLHMQRAVSGIMYLVQECFRMDRSMLFCPADEKVGMFLLYEMMASGNFGHDDNRYKHLDKNLRWQRGIIGLKRNWKYLRYFPEEVLWSPLWKIWHYCWRKKKGYL